MVRSLIPATLLLAALSSLSCAESVVRPLLHPLLGSGATLQRERPIRLWGWSDPGVTVTVSIENGSERVRNATALVDSNGRWTTTVDSLPVGDTYSITASDSKQKTRSERVCVGDVWLCAGQSNMEMPVSRAAGFDVERKDGNQPRVRSFKVGRLIAGHPVELTAGAWQITNPSNVGGCSAVAYRFARELQRAHDIPVGVIVSSWGGTTAEAWMSADSLAPLPGMQGAVDEFHAQVAAVDEQTRRTGSGYATLLESWYRDCDPGTTQGWQAIDLVEDGWTTVNLPGEMTPSPLSSGYTGSWWLRRAIDLGSSHVGGLTLELGQQAGLDTVYVNGRSLASGDESSGTWGRLRRVVVPADVVHQGRNMLAIRLVELRGKPALRTMPDIALRALRDDGSAVSLAGPWLMRAGTALSSVRALPVRYDQATRVTSLYNGMIAPLAPMSLSGVVWYQGESNVSRAAQYGQLLTALIADWRRTFAEPELPFLIVQLPNFHPRASEPSSSSWAELREAQDQTVRKVPRAGLAVTIDQGEAGDIHPRDKSVVGYRLALAAQAVAYKENIGWYGPRFRTARFAAGEVIVEFDDGGDGLVLNGSGQQAGFAIAGEDRRFVWADARVVDGHIVLSSATVSQPIAVRYAWADNPACGLTNRSKLPAAPFRSDNWQDPPSR